MDLTLPRLNALRDSEDEPTTAGVERRYLTRLSGEGVSQIDDANEPSLGVIDSAGSDHVVMSSQDKVIVGYWLVQAVLNVALSRGANKNKLLRGTGIFEDGLQHHSLLSTKQYSSLLVNVQSQARGGDVSFLLGGALVSQWRSSPLNVLKTCENVEQLLFHLTQLQTFRWCSIPLCQFQRFESVNKIMLVPHFTGVSSKQFQFTIEVAFASVVALLKSIANKRIRMSFTFTGSRPKNIADYETHLGLKLSFNSPFNSICIEKDELRHSLEQTVQSIHTIESQFSLKGFSSCSATLTNGKTSIELQNRMPLPDFVRRYVYVSSNTQAANIGLPELAQILDVSVATLKRKLKEYGTSYRALSEEVLRNHALLLLSVHKVSNETAANAMGINDLPNFRRTVKRLTGKTPSELRI
ncbi:helix-turn-helix domain-containing protein [Alteromonas sp. S015]|uniref:helix-turn-helix domain-containing protein n=1 Tax=Alteromonas sp. S015 TaxID=3117401 RepID=UPI002FE001B4